MWVEFKHYAFPFYKVFLNKSTVGLKQVTDTYLQKPCILYRCFLQNEIKSYIFLYLKIIPLHWIKWKHFLHDPGIMQVINKVTQDMGQSPWLNLKTSAIMTSKGGIMASQGSFIRHLLPGRETHHLVDRRVVTLQV